MLMGDYLHDRSLHVVVNGQQSRKLPVGASVPQGFVLGPVLWNLYIDNLLRTLPTVSAYANNCTLSRSYSCQHSQQAVTDVNQQLQAIKRWEERWQVSYATEKTQTMVVSWSPETSQAVEGKVKRESERERADVITTWLFDKSTYSSVTACFEFLPPFEYKCCTETARFL